MSEKSLAAKKAWKTRRKKARMLSLRARKAWETRLTNWEKLRKSVLLIECIPEQDVGCSEAKMLKELFRIIDLQMGGNCETVDYEPKKADTPEQLLKILRKAEQSCIHISCHGSYYSNYRKTGFNLSEGRLFSDQLTSSKNEELPIWSDRLNGKESTIPQLVFLSACETARHTDLVERLLQAGVRYVVAPKNVTPFSDASLFASTFYSLVYVEQKNPYLAFTKVKKAFPKMAGNWQFFDQHKHIFKVYDPNGIGKL